MNTLKIEAKLAEKYKYKKLPDDLSEKYRQYFTENIPDGLSLNGGILMTINGSPNCDSQLPTFKSRNKNSARNKRKEFLHETVERLSDK